MKAVIIARVSTEEQKDAELLRTSMRKNEKIAKLHFTDEEYYLTSKYLLKLASNASKLFESSEVHEKRLLLKMTLQNLELNGKKARYDCAFCASRQLWLERWYDYRTTDWTNYLEYPEFTLKQTQLLLTID